MIQWYKRYKRSKLISSLKPNFTTPNSNEILIICDQVLINSNLTKYTTLLNRNGFTTYIINISDESYTHADIELKPSQNTWFELPNQEIIESLKFSNYGYTLLFLNTYSHTLDFLLQCNPSQIVIGPLISEIIDRIDISLEMESNFDTLSYIQEIRNTIDSLNP